METWLASLPWLLCTMLQWVQEDRDLGCFPLSQLCTEEMALKLLEQADAALTGVLLCSSIAIT